MISTLSLNFEAQPKLTAYLLLCAPVPTPQLNLDSFVFWGNAVKAVDPATPSPRALILEVLVEILEVLVEMLFLLVVIWELSAPGVTSIPSINSLLLSILIGILFPSASSA